MALITTNPNDLTGQMVRLARIPSVDMTTQAVYNWMNNGPNAVLLLAWVLHDFSAFPDGTAPPATWAFSYGTNSSTTPNNMRAAGVISGAIATPVVASQALSNVGITPYILPFQTLYLAVTTTTNGVGTFQASAYGIILSR